MTCLKAAVQFSVWTKAPTADNSHANQTLSFFFILQAVEEEKSVYERSSSKSIYLNLAVHSLRRLREEATSTTTNTTTTAAALTTTTLSPSKNPHSVSHELILAGPKACQTSFSVHRCGKQSSPPSSFSGNSTQVICYIIIMAAGHLFYRCSLDLSFFLLLCRLISEVAWPIVTKLCHMFDGDPDL